VLGLKTTAEGIETQEVLDRLTELGCDAGQGFLFGRPEAVAAQAVGEGGAAKAALRRA
jgi:EAL domain-containing protein (putative c-di-GMP-specific phosphodiesterase class I)